MAAGRCCTDSLAGGDSVSSAEAVFPAFLRLGGRSVVVVGGGPVAASKLAGLRRACAQVTVVAPQILPAILETGVRVKRRRFAPNDLEGAWFVVAAATPNVNREVAREGERRRIFVNAVDDPRSASAFQGGVFERGGVTVALSTGGAAPAVAGLLREGLEALIPEDVSGWIEEAKGLRQAWRGLGVPLSSRRPLLLHALNRRYADRRVGRGGDDALAPVSEPEAIA
jgi:uroporphyrin-III C-methyltransferase / precorrin-2 dehydrogenase / sirohydrochlorin ferrochelatase